MGADVGYTVLCCITLLSVVFVDAAAALYLTSAVTTGRTGAIGL